jgi:hypothetical protein
MRQNIISYQLSVISYQFWVLSEQYVLSEPDQMPVYYCLFTDYCLLLTDHCLLITEKSQAWTLKEGKIAPFQTSGPWSCPDRLGHILDDKVEVGGCCHGIFLSQKT